MNKQEQTIQIPVPETRRVDKAGSLVKKTIGAAVAAALLLAVPMSAMAEVTWETTANDTLNLAGGTSTALAPDDGVSTHVENGDSLHINSGDTLTIIKSGAGVTLLDTVSGDGDVVFNADVSVTNLYTEGLATIGSGATLTVGHGEVYGTIINDGTLIITTDLNAAIDNGKVTFTDAYDGSGTLDLEEGTIATFEVASIIAILKGTGDIIVDDDLTIKGTNGKAGHITNNGTVNISGGSELSGIAGGTINVTAGTNYLGVLSGGITLTVADGATAGINVGATGSNFDIDAFDAITLNASGKIGFYGADAGESITIATDTLLDLFGGDFDSAEELKERIVGLKGTTIAGFDVDESGNLVIITFGVSSGTSGYTTALMMHHRYTVLNAVRDRLISGNGGNLSGYRGQWADCTPCEAACFDPCEPVCGTGFFNGGGSRSAWVNYVGRTDEFANGELDNWKLSSEGIQMGADLFRTKNTQFGALFGYEGARMRSEDDTVKMDSTYFGFYGARVFRSGADARVIFSYGHQKYGMGFDFDNGTYADSFKGYTTETTLELGKRYGRGSWSVRPVVALDIFNNNLKGNDKFDKTSLTQSFFRMGSDMRFQNRNFTFNSGFYYSYDMNNNNREDLVAMSTSGEAFASKPGRELLTFNMGTDLQITKNMSIFGGYQGEYVTDRANSQVHSTGYVGAGFKW